MTPDLPGFQAIDVERDWLETTNRMKTLTTILLLPVVLLIVLVGCSAFHPFGLGAPGSGPKPPPSNDPGQAVLTWIMWVGGAEIVAGGLMFVLSKGGAGKKLLLLGVATLLGARFLSKYGEILNAAALVAAVLVVVWEVFLHREKIMGVLRLGRQPDPQPKVAA